MESKSCTPTHLSTGSDIDQSRKSIQHREIKNIMHDVSLQITGLVNNSPQKEAATHFMTQENNRTGNRPNGWTNTTEGMLKSLSMLPKDSELYHIQLEHISELSRIKFEMEPGFSNKVISGSLILGHHFTWN